MSDEDVTRTTSYFNALKAVADAARTLEEVRVRYEDAVDRLGREKREAEEQFRQALEHVSELVGEPLPRSERDEEDRRMREMLQGMRKKEDGKK